MKKNRIYSVYLNDMLNSASKAIDFASGMRDKLIHDYFGVNSKIVWKTIKEDLPILKK